MLRTLEWKFFRGYKNFPQWITLTCQLKSRNKTNFPFKHIFVSFTVTRFKDTFLMEEYAPLFRGKSSSSKKIVAPIGRAHFSSSIYLVELRLSVWCSCRLNSSVRFDWTHDIQFQRQQSNGDGTIKTRVIRDKLYPDNGCVISTSSKHGYVI